MRHIEMYMLNWFKDVNNTSHFLNGYHQGRLSVFISIMFFFVGHALSDKYKFYTLLKYINYCFVYKFISAK